MAPISAESVERSIYALSLAVLLWAPLPYASNRSWAAALLALLVGVLLCTWLLLWLAGGVKIQREPWRAARGPLERYSATCS